MHGLKSSIDEEKEMEGSIGGGNMFQKVKQAMKHRVFRRGLLAGVTVQVAQQFVGINTVMYYSPTIIQFAGFASNSTALALSLITSGLNAVGSIVSMCFVDRYGRRRLMLISMLGIISCLVVLSGVFFAASANSPAISTIQSSHFGANATCSAFVKSPDASSWNCMKCLQATDCAFCSNPGQKYSPGACLAKLDPLEGSCKAEHGIWYEKGCPSKFGFLAVVFLGLYIIMYSPGMGTVPWIVNSEIYPLRYRGIGGGIAAVANWTSNLIVSQTFLTLTEVLGSAGTFLLFAGFSFVGMVLIFFLVPETKGLPFEEVEKMLEKGFNPFKGKKDDKPVH